MYKIEDINYMLSLYCPGKCKNCNIWKFDKSIRNNEISESMVSRLFRSTALSNIKYIDLTAGESQLSSKYVSTIKTIGSFFSNCKIHTNISGWYPKHHLKTTRDSLKVIGANKMRIDISVDGPEEIYSGIRLVKNGFEKLQETIKYLKDLDIEIRLTFIVYPANLHYIRWLVDFSKDNGVGYYIGYARNSSLLNNRDIDYQYTPEQLEIIEESLTAVGWLTEQRKPNWLWAKSIYENKIPQFECQMGTRSIVIDPYGNVFPCNDCIDDLNMGNIKHYNGDLDQLLDTPQAKSVIQKISEYHCQPCSMLCAHKIEFPWGKQIGMQDHDNIKVKENT